MLGQVVTPMSQPFQFAQFHGPLAVRPIPARWARAGKVALRSLPLLVCAASLSLLRAQTSAQSANPGVAAPSADPAFTISGLGQGPSAPGQYSGQNHYQPADPFGRRSAGSRQWNNSALNPFQPRTSFGSFSGSASSSFSPFAAAPLALPSLNQLMRGSFSLPSSPTFGTFRLSYRDALRPGVNFGDLARPSNSLMFSTTDLGNGMFLSAGTGFGHTTAGAPASGLGSSTSGDAKHSGPSVAVKLSF